MSEILWISASVNVLRVMRRTYSEYHHIFMVYENDYAHMIDIN